MPQLRFDITTADWVVFAPSRKLRPHERERKAESVEVRTGEQPALRCPFCPGNESMTPAETYSERSDGRWLVRVFPNRFPALRIEEDHHRIQEGRTFRSMGGCGAHEVLVESPEHDTDLSHQPLEQIERVLRAALSRYRDLMRDRRFQAVIIFKNHGMGAGTSLRHPHWQVIAVPVVPRLHRIKYTVATEYFDETGDCIYCVMLEEEMAIGQRIVASNDAFVAVVPYAAHVPFETWILPRRHQASFGDLEGSQIGPLAKILKTVLMKLYVALDNPDFNLIIDTAPRGDEDKEYFLWHIQILPRLSTPAGFELGSGMSINTVLPEEAAEFLRNGSEEANSSGDTSPRNIVLPPSTV